MDVKVIEEVLGVLVSPSITGLDSLENVFAANIRNVTAKINSCEKYQFLRDHLSSSDLITEGDTHWRFARLNLRLIRLLQTALHESITRDQQALEETPRQSMAPALPADSLSILQQKTIATSLQFVACFGICPYLLPGVGLPLSLRCGYGGSMNTGISPDRDEMDRRLMTSVVTLLECVVDVSSRTLGEMIISRHLVDILAALFQIRHVSTRRYPPMSEGKDAEIGRGSSSGVDCQGQGFSGNSRERVERPRDVDFCLRQLDVLLEKSYQPSLIQQLLILQNGPPPSPSLMMEKVNVPPSPVWLRKLTRKCLVAAIMRPSGIQALFAVLLQEKNATSSAESRRYDDVARIVVDIPLGAGTTVESYYESISCQVLELIRMDAKRGMSENDVRASHRRHCVRAAVQMVSLMAQRQPRLTERFLMDALLRPLLQCLARPDDPVREDGSSSHVVVEESVLTSCLEDLSTLTTGPDSSLVSLLYPVLGVLLPLYHHVRQSVTYLRSKVEEILHWIFRHIDLPITLRFLSQFCLEMNIDPNDHSIDRMSDDLRFSSGESGGLSVVSQTRKKSTLDVSDWESLAENVVHLIISSKRQDDIGAELFLLCLRCLSDIVSDEVDSSVGGDIVIDARGRGGISGHGHFDSEEDGEADAEARRIRRNLVVVTLLTKMCEKFGPSCMNKSEHILGFVEATLTRGVKIVDNTSDPLFGAFEMETLSMALGLLTSLFADKQKRSGLDWQRLQLLIPLLQKLSDSTVDPSLQEMALDLRIAIATHGLVGLGSSGATVPSGTKSKVEHQREVRKDKVARVPESSGVSKKKKSPMIEVLSSTETSESLTTVPEVATSPTDAPTYQQMAALVCDSSVPERGHALVGLRRLVEQRDAETLANGESILQVCCLNLVHPDTYIYLAAIQVIAALAGACPEMVVPRIAERYADSGPRAERGSSELTMKLGEVLVKISVGLGDFVPHYRDLLLRSVLSVAKDPDAFVRASTMSNLGEICRLLRFGLGSVIHEIFACVRSLLKYDESVEVRRGAAMFTTLLLRGLSRDMFEVLGNQSTEFLRLIKDVLKRDKDDLVRHHAQASLEVLEGIVRDFLIPPQTMEKRIRFP